MDPERRPNRSALAAAIIGALAVLVVVAAVFGLGPFADDELSAPEFIARADEICVDAHDEFLDLQSNAPRTADDAASITQALIEIAEGERTDVAELGAPETLEERVADYLEQRDRGIEILRDGLGAARDEDAGAYETAQAKLAANQRRRALAAEEIGFSECSQPLVKDEELKRQSEAPEPSDPDAPPTVSNPPTGG